MFLKQTRMFPFRAVYSHPADASPRTGDRSQCWFSYQLPWSYCVAEIRLEAAEVREFYKLEAISGGWDKWSSTELLTFDLPNGQNLWGF